MLIGRGYTLREEGLIQGEILFHILADRDRIHVAREKRPRIVIMSHKGRNTSITLVW